MSELIDREAAISKIEPWLYSEGRGESELNMLRAVIAELKSLPAAPRWVRCEDRLPENKKHYYLVCTDMGYMCSCRWTNNVYGFRESDEWGWSMIDVPQYQKVTHWMPIEPPKEDA